MSTKQIEDVTKTTTNAFFINLYVFIWQSLLCRIFFACY